MWPGVTMSRCGCDVALVPPRVLHGVGLDQRRHLLGVRVRNRILADDRDRRGLAAADARRVQDANVRAEQAGNAASSSREPAISHAIESQTRTVIAGGARRRPSPRRSGDRTSPLRRPRPSPSSFRRRARPDAARTGSRSDPESCADARSADPAGAGRCREAPARPRAPSDRRGGPSGVERARLSACLVLGIVCILCPSSPTAR